MNEARDNDIVVASSSPSLGEQLRQARESKKYSIAEVAAQLRLTKDIVNYMETQQWDKLHGRTYARGYFASYVKFLGLPFDEMLAVFNLEYSVSEPSLNLLQTGREQEDKQFPWFMLALMVVVTLVIWLAFQQWQQTQVITPSPLSESEQTDTEDNFSPSIVEPLDTQPVTVEKMAPDAAKTAEQLGTSANNLDEIIATEAVTTAAGTIDTSTTSTLSSEQATETPMIEESTLQLSFTGECWVEVTNADSQVLVSKVMRADQSLLLKSDQPLNVLLGRAAAASLTFNNQSVDLSPYIDGDIARLTLGVES